MKKPRGGRSARRSARLEGAGGGASRAIWPGLSGGHYRPLTEQSVQAVHETVLRILAEVGLQGATARCRETVIAAGGQISADGGRLLIPAGLVKQMLAVAGREFRLYGQQEQYDIQPRGTQVYFGTAGAAVHIIDSETRSVRDSTLRDLYDMACLVDALPNIHMFQRTVVARDIPDAYTMDINTAYACALGTAKPIGTSFSSRDALRDSIAIFHLIAGGESAWRTRPFCWVSTCFIVPPLTFAEEALGIIETAVEAGAPLKLVSAGQAGATSPASLAGAVAQQTAEVLAGLVYVNLLKPGHPALFTALPFISDLRTGAMSGGSAEQGVLMAACAQMAQHYGIPCAVSAGMTDAKMPDYQAGYEKGITELLSGLAGGNLIHEAAGMYGSLLAASCESFVLDNDLIGSVMRATRGIEVNQETLAFDVIREVCIDGPGHFLAHDQTLARMQSDYYYPALADRSTPEQWYAGGVEDLLEKARQKTRRILTGPRPGHINDTTDQIVRKRFPIRL